MSFFIYYRNDVLGPTNKHDRFYFQLLDLSKKPEAFETVGSIKYKLFLHFHSSYKIHLWLAQAGFIATLINSSSSQAQKKSSNKIYGAPFFSSLSNAIRDSIRQFIRSLLLTKINITVKPV